MKKLNERHILFVAHYLKTLKGAESARVAGFSPATARVQASQLLADPLIQAEIAKHRPPRSVDSGAHPHASPPPKRFSEAENVLEEMEKKRKEYSPLDPKHPDFLKMPETVPQRHTGVSDSRLPSGLTPHQATSFWHDYYDRQRARDQAIEQREKTKFRGFSWRRR